MVEAGGDFRYEAVVYEEPNRRGLSGFGQGVHSIAAHYLLNHGTEEQKHRLLPALARELIGAIGITETRRGLRHERDTDAGGSRG
jgi:acyl-CoA dehydrogenase